MPRFTLAAAMVLAAALLPSPAAAEAEEIPRLDVERNCAAIYKTHAGLYNDCIAEEEFMYRRLEMVWSGFSPSVRGGCSDRMVKMVKANTIGGSLYGVMIQCLVDFSAKESAEKSNQPRRRFTP